MKEKVWYHASYDEIWVTEIPYRIIRGPQGMNYNKLVDEWIPDYIELFSWGIDPKKWRREVKLGYLICLGDL